MKKPKKKAFVSSKEDRGIIIKFLKNKTTLSFWGDEADVPREIDFSNEDALAFCNYIIEELSEDNDDLREIKEWSGNLLEQMNRTKDGEA